MNFLFSIFNSEPLFQVECNELLNDQVSPDQRGFAHPKIQVSEKASVAKNFFRECHVHCLHQLTQGKVM